MGEKGLRSGTVQPSQRRLFSRQTAAVWAGSRESELARLVKEMNFLSAHRSSNPICPATQSVSRVCGNAIRSERGPKVSDRPAPQAEPWHVQLITPRSR